MQDLVDTQRKDVDEEISAFAIGAALVRGRGRILRLTVIGALLATPLAFIPDATYTARASFVPVATGDAGRAGLTSLAGQFGISLGSSSGQEQSSEFYAELIRARAVLAPVLLDSIDVAGKRCAVLDALGVEEGPDSLRLEEGLRTILDGMVGTSVSTSTSVVMVSAKTKTPELSIELVRRILAAVNEFNLSSRRGQASNEREFTERRLADARDSLDVAEAQLGRFLQANRQFANLPLLVFEHDRLKRAVELRQGVLNSVATALEDARAREVRDTPLITVVETPYLPATADPRSFALIAGGAFLGLLAGLSIIVVWELVARRRARGDTDVNDFLTAVDELRTRALAMLRPRR